MFLTHLAKRYRSRAALVLCAVMLLAVGSVLSVAAIELGGFASWFSVNMTGAGTSHTTLNMSGMTTTRFTIDTSFVVLSAPTGLTLSLISSNEVLITWTMGLGACNSMVRGAVGRTPTDRSDGYLVYYGNATSTTDWVNTDSDVVYYRVWSQGCSGTWEAEGISDSIGGSTIMMIGLIVLVVVLTVLAFVLKNPILHLVCVPAWISLGVYLWNMASWPEGNTYLPTAFLSLAIVVAIVNLVVTVNHYLGQRTVPPSHEEVQSTYRKRIADITRRNNPEDFWR